MRCQACGISARPTLAIHHVIPLSLGGRNISTNLTTLCANCHRIVHWLAAGDRSVDAHAYGLGRSGAHRRRLLALARRIRHRRQRVVGRDLVLSTSVPLETAMGAVVQRNGLDASEAALMRRCFKRALRAMAARDRKACSVRLVREARFLSVNANNHLVLRAPAWSDSRQRMKGDILLVWPQRIRPSIMSSSRFRRESSGRFKLIPHFILSLTWDECLSLSERDWKVYQQACHDALTLVRTRRWASNVIL
jgi:HNH endonuclease